MTPALDAYRRTFARLEQAVGDEETDAIVVRLDELWDDLDVEERAIWRSGRDES